MTNPTQKARDFMKANDESPVISGAAFGQGGEGGSYTLLDKRQFSLNLKDCQSLREGYPKWCAFDD